MMRGELGLHPDSQHTRQTPDGGGRGELEKRVIELTRQQNAQLRELDGTIDDLHRQAEHESGEKRTRTLGKITTTRAEKARIVNAFSEQKAPLLRKLEDLNRSGLSSQAK